jgi:hypothetical protein
MEPRGYQVVGAPRMAESPRQWNKLVPRVATVRLRAALTICLLVGEAHAVQTLRFATTAPKASTWGKVL